jgi:hypothetical protein
MAWLHATPKPDPRTKRGKRAEAEAEAAPKISRIEQLKRDRITPQMPPNPAPHIVEWLIEIGLTDNSGMSATPLTWCEINAWCARTRVSPAPWEARLIRRLSSDYIAESRKAESETCPPPWRAEVSQRELDIEEARLRNVLG